jgi:hypothetical protein
MSEQVLSGRERMLIAYWSFDEGSGQVAYDYSGNENNAQIMGAEWTDGVSGKALSFNGRSSLICGGGLELCFVFPSDYSIEAWVKHEAKTPQAYVSKWSGWRMESAWVLGYFEETVNFAEYYGGGEHVRVKGPNIADGQWHHIVAVREGENIRLYVDGRREAEAKSKGGIVGENLAPVKVGSAGAGRWPRWPFIGLIDEVRVYARAISEDEILSRYQNVRSGIKKPTLKPLLQEIPLSFYIGGTSASLYNVGEPIDVRLTITSSKPVPHPLEQRVHVYLKDKDGNVIYSSKSTLSFKEKEKVKVTSVSTPPQAEGSYLVEIGIDEKTGLRRILQVKNIEPIKQENMRIKEERSKTNPFYRGIISAYGGMRYKPDDTPDIEGTLSVVEDLGANCYTYLIHSHSEKELAALGEFCKEARVRGIEVWVYLVPPSEALPGYPPFGLDYLKWAEAIAEISLQHPNLTLWMIDDFDGNLSFFTIDYTRRIYERTKEINPNLFFGVCVYHESLDKFVKNGYLAYIDALLWGYQHSSFLYPDCGIYPNTLPLEINDYLKTGKIAIPCIYFTAHSSWPLNRPIREYLEKAMRIAYEQAGICWVFTTPSPGTFQYEVVKEFARQVKAPKRRW